MNPEQVPLIQQVSKIASEKVDEEDYDQQVDRWNRYQEGLDRIEHQCQVQNVRFRRRMRTSYSERRIRNLKQGAAIGLLASAISIIAFSLWWNAYFEKPVNIYLILQDRPTVDDALDSIANQAVFTFFVIGGLAASILWNTGKLPDKIQFECRPVIFIDDLYFLQRYVRGMARERHDPKIVLPELRMELPQSYIKQMSLLKLMGTMKDVKF